MAKRPPRHKVNRKQRAKAISALSRIVELPTAAEYVVAKAASALLGAAKADDDAAPERDPDAPRTVIFLPKKPRLPGQREDESLHDFNARTMAQVEGRRAALLREHRRAVQSDASLPVLAVARPGNAPELEDAADRMADAAEAAEIERQRTNPRPALVEILGPREDSPCRDFLRFSTPEGRADYRRWKADAIAQGHAILEPQ